MWCEQAEERGDEALGDGRAGIVYLQTWSAYAYICLGFCRYDHQERLSAKEASAHPYFAPVRQAAARGGSPGTIGFPV